MGGLVGSRQSLQTWGESWYFAETVFTATLKEKRLRSMVKTTKVVSVKSAWNRLSLQIWEINSKWHWRTDVNIIEFKNGRAKGKCYVTSVGDRELITVAKLNWICVVIRSNMLQDWVVSSHAIWSTRIRVPVTIKRRPLRGHGRWWCNLEIRKSSG